MRCHPAGASPHLRAWPPAPSHLRPSCESRVAAAHQRSSSRLHPVRIFRPSGSRPGHPPPRRTHPRHPSWPHPPPLARDRPLHAPRSSRAAAGVSSGRCVRGRPWRPQAIIRRAPARAAPCGGAHTRAAAIVGPPAASTRPAAVPEAPYDFSIPGVLKSASANLLCQSDSFADGDKISLTKMANGSVGRVAYAQPVRLWDYRTGSIASFSTSFSFTIDGNHNNTRGDGMAFFIGPFPSIVPPDSSAGFLGLYSNPAHYSGSLPVVAVEFDTFWNPELDPPGVSDHVGIDITSIHSTSYTTDLQNLGLYGTMSANITYDASSKMMSVSLRLADGTIHRVQTLVDFKNAGLPQDVAVGFSGATGAFWESHQLLSWSFTSTDMEDPSYKTKPRLFQGLAYGEGACLLAAILYIGIDCFIRRARPRPRRRSREIPLTTGTDSSPQGLLKTTDTTGPIMLPVPREFTYQELSVATDNFSSVRKLGEGAFGEVYLGVLLGQLSVAVKKLTLQSERTRRDYANEIMILGQMNHRNLVKLIGWCDGGEHLLLVYELMADRSVDRYLHGHDKKLLTWLERYDIVLAVGRAIEYLHTGCRSTILHRDIKPSNVMLKFKRNNNEDFQAKLGDFGLVRQVPRQGYLRGTAMIGSTDYIDPVCISNSTATTASDMYSFGVLLLEVATGKDPAAMREEVGRTRALIDAVMDSCARGTILQEADRRLNGNFDQWEMERVLVVGLLCVQSDRRQRPDIREAVCVLSNREHPLPKVPVQNESHSPSL